LHIDLDEKTALKCDVYRKVNYFPDRKVGTVEFTPKELQTGQKRAQVKRKIMDKNGTPTLSELELDLITKQWKDVYGDLDVPTEGCMEPFFRIAAAILGTSVEKTHNPSADQLKRPAKAADPNLERKKLLGGVLQFPVDGEFESVGTEITRKLWPMNKIPFFDTQTRHRNRDNAIYQICKVFKKSLMKEPREDRWDNSMRDTNNNNNNSMDYSC
jgi:hypothetical protein